MTEVGAISLPSRPRALQNFEKVGRGEGMVWEREGVDGVKEYTIHNSLTGLKLRIREKGGIVSYLSTRSHEASIFNDAPETEIPNSGLRLGADVSERINSGEGTQNLHHTDELGPTHGRLHDTEISNISFLQDPQTGEIALVKLEYLDLSDPNLGYREYEGKPLKITRYLALASDGYTDIVFAEGRDNMLGWGEHTYYQINSVDDVFLGEPINQNASAIYGRPDSEFAAFFPSGLPLRYTLQRTTRSASRIKTSEISREVSGDYAWYQLAQLRGWHDRAATGSKPFICLELESKTTGNRPFSNEDADQLMSSLLKDESLATNSLRELLVQIPRDDLYGKRIRMLLDNPEMRKILTAGIEKYHPEFQFLLQSSYGSPEITTQLGDAFEDPTLYRNRLLSYVRQASGWRGLSYDDQRRMENVIFSAPIAYPHETIQALQQKGVGIHAVEQILSDLTEHPEWDSARLSLDPQVVLQLQEPDQFPEWQQRRNSFFYTNTMKVSTTSHEQVLPEVT